jgi:hypothetical protein
MSALSSHRIRSFGSGTSRPGGLPSVRTAPPVSFDALWQNVVAFVSLAMIGVIVAYLIFMG